MRKRLLLLAVAIITAGALLAQSGSEGTIVTSSEGAPPVGYEQVMTYSGSNLVATCIAPADISAPGSLRARTSVSVSSATNANPAVLTSTAHGFAVSSRPKVTISGATGNWTPINGTFTATVVDANTFSIPVDSTTFGALTGTITFVTTAPRSGMAEWAVKKLAYDISNNLIWVGWLNGSSKYQAKCSDASSSTVNQQ